MVRPWTSIAMFALIAVLMGVDTVIDYRQSGSFFAQTFEMLVFAAALAGIGIHAWQLASARLRSEQLGRELRETRADAQRFSREAQDALKGLGVAIDRQFDKWGLSPAERDVALLQLKGLRHKEIAELRKTSERTVRQQALAIYRKAGLSGRTDLAAFFLEDLLLPGVRHPSDASPADAG
jgi:DNA-binding CsgD family transcriptional regulator